MNDEPVDPKAETKALEVVRIPRRVRSISSDEIKAELKGWARASILSKTWKLTLLCVLAGFVCSAILLWFSASTALLARIQTFNGALTIPVGALTWAFAFTFVFLVPMKAMQILMAKTMLYSIEAQEDLVEDIKRDFIEPMKRGNHPIIKRFEKVFRDEMRLLREEIRNQGEAVESTIDEALEQGEKRAQEEVGASETYCDACKGMVPTTMYGDHRANHGLDPTVGTP